MFILDFVSGIITWFFQLWQKLPPAAKKEIIDALVAGFETLFRAYYQNWKEESNEQ